MAAGSQLSWGERTVEVCLDGVFEREYRKFESAISVGIGAGRRRDGPGRAAKGSWREASGRGKGENRRYRDSLRRRGWHLFRTALSRFSSSKRVAPVRD